MPLLMFVIFIAVPLVEIALFIFVGERIGVGATIALVILTAVIGTYLLQAQGLSVFTRAQKALSEGRIPVDSVIDGSCLLVAGAFLLTPGLLTDTIGFLLFVPPLRRAIARWAFSRMVASKSVHFEVFTSETQERRGPAGRAEDFGEGPIIEGEFERKDEDETAKGNGRGNMPSKDSPWRK